MDDVLNDARGNPSAAAARSPSPLPRFAAAGGAAGEVRARPREGGGGAFPVSAALCAHALPASPRARARCRAAGVATARGEAGSWPGLAGSSFSAPLAALDGARWLRSGSQQGLDPWAAAPDGGGCVGGCGLATGDTAAAVMDDPCARRLMEAIGIDLGEDLLAVAAEAGDGGTIWCRSLVEGIAVEKFQATICYIRGKP